MAGVANQLGEINSFVGKFIKLCEAGIKANLSFEYNAAGKADIILKVALDKVEQVPQHQLQPQHYTRTPGPSRKRRLQSRAEARRSAATEAVENEENNKAVVSEEAVDIVAEEATDIVAEEATDIVAEEASKEEVDGANHSLNVKKPTSTIAVEALETIDTFNDESEGAISPIPQLDGDMEIDEEKREEDTKMVDKVCFYNFPTSILSKKLEKEVIKKRSNLNLRHLVFSSENSNLLEMSNISIVTKPELKFGSILS